jgi:hypothetical protein
LHAVKLRNNIHRESICRTDARVVELLAATPVVRIGRTLLPNVRSIVTPVWCGGQLDFFHVLDGFWVCEDVRILLVCLGEQAQLEGTTDRKAKHFSIQQILEMTC